MMVACFRSDIAAPVVSICILRINFNGLGKIFNSFLVLSLLKFLKPLINKVLFTLEEI
jgi:hypothetical protein